MKNASLTKKLAILSLAATLMTVTVFGPSLLGHAGPEEPISVTYYPDSHSFAWSYAEEWSPEDRGALLGLINTPASFADACAEVDRLLLTTDPRRMRGATIYNTKPSPISLKKSCNCAIIVQWKAAADEDLRKGIVGTVSELTVLVLRREVTIDSDRRVHRMNAVIFSPESTTTTRAGVVMRQGKFRHIDNRPPAPRQVVRSVKNTSPLIERMMFGDSPHLTDLSGFEDAGA